MFGTTTIIKINDKEKWVYSGYGIAFDGKGGALWYRYSYVINVVLFGVNSTRSSHIHNHKNIFLILSE